MYFKLHSANTILLCSKRYFHSNHNTFIIIFNYHIQNQLSQFEYKSAAIAINIRGVKKQLIHC